ncbi:MAG: 30S ribosomal protein S2 [Deltaproteobacteria bacterium]|nr:30S ribosomal protein S2 [Deltaproteobacteria bacterium]
MSVVTMKQLLEAGVHFGHQTPRWNPRMKPYIFGARNGIHIIDLQKTEKLFTQACEIVKETIANGGKILMIGTKKQAQDAIEEESQRAGAYYVNHRWLGGTLTNFETIKKSVEKLKWLETIIDNGTIEDYPKKEQISMKRHKMKLDKSLHGIKHMDTLPDIVYVVDPTREGIAVLECRKLGITTVGIVDTNCNPTLIDYVIPGNDDAIRAIRLFTSKIADAVVEGNALYQEKLQAKIKEEEAAAELEVVQEDVGGTDQYIGQDLEDEIEIIVKDEDGVLDTKPAPEVAEESVPEELQDEKSEADIEELEQEEDPDKEDK